MTPQSRKGRAKTSPVSTPPSRVTRRKASAPTARSTAPTMVWVRDRPRSTGLVSGSGALTLSAPSDWASPSTSSSSDTPKSRLIATSLSSSGTELPVSHLDMDWRETSSSEARSP